MKVVFPAEMQAEEPVKEEKPGLLKAAKVIRELSNICVLITVMTCLIFSVFTVPRLFHISPFVVQSASMEPTIPTGSVVFVDNTDTDAEVGDIVTYSISIGEGKGVFVTHRIHDMDEERGLIQTKGDNNENADGWIAKTAIVGTVLTYIPWCGFVLDALQEVGFVLIAAWIFIINLILMLLPPIFESMASHRGGGGL